MVRFFEYSLGKQGQAFSRLIQGKELIDPEPLAKFAEKLKAWAQNHGVTQFGYSNHSFYEHSPHFFELETFCIDDLSKKKIDISSFLNLDPTATPYIYQDKLWIPSLVFSDTKDVCDFKAPLIRSLQKLKSLADVHLSIVMKVVITLFDQDVVESCPDLNQLGRRVYGLSKNLKEGRKSQDFLKEGACEAGLHGINIAARKNKKGASEYEVTFLKEDVLVGIDQSIFFLKILKAVGEKEKKVVHIVDVEIDIPRTLAKSNVFNIALNHALHEHRDLLSTFCLGGELIRKEALQLKGLKSPSDAMPALSALFAATADSLQFILSKPKADVSLFEKYTQEPWIKSEKTFSEVYAPFSDHKTARIFSGVLSASELDCFHKVFLSRYVFDMKREIALMIELFREKILPLQSKLQSLSFNLEKVSGAIDDLEHFTKTIDDLGIEAQGKAIFEIGFHKMLHVKDLVNKLCIDF